MAIRRAVVVGVNKYESEDFHPLAHAVDDAVRMKGFLERLRREGAFERVRLLVEPSDHQLQTELRIAAKGLGAGDLLLFYFAGHGVLQNATGQHLLLCPQARKDILQYGTNGALPHLFLDHLARQGAHDSLFVFDACRNELLVHRGAGGASGMRGSAALRTIGETQEQARARSSSCVKLWSCNDGEQAAERAELEGGVFTCSLVSTLESMLGEGQSLSIDEPFVSRVAQAMDSSGVGGSQQPQYSASGRGVTLHVGPAGASPSVAPPIPPPPVPEILWHVSVEGVVSEGMSLAVLKRRIRSGGLSRRTLVWSSDLGVWSAAGDVPSLSCLFPRVAVAVQPPAPPPLPAPVAGEAKTVELRGGVELELVWCPAGEFLMGSPAAEPERSSDEIQHEVELTRGFWLGKYALTQRQWESVMGSNPSHFAASGPDAPVESVSWDDCQAFLEKANTKAEHGGALRLPTETEWEYACRAGTRTAFHYGDDLDSSLANFDGNHPFGNGGKGVDREKTVKVGSLKPNAWGLHDMHGNVWEWCHDWYDANYYGESPRQDPMGPATGSFRVNRGGSWNSGASYCRAAYRDRNEPGDRYNCLGLRLALSPAVH